MRSGDRPSPRSSRTDDWVGLVLASPVDFGCASEFILQLIGLKLLAVQARKILKIFLFVSISLSQKVRYSVVKKQRPRGLGSQVTASNMCCRLVAY